MIGLLVNNNCARDAMHRRSILWGTLSAIGAAFAASRANATAEAPQQKLKEIGREHV